MFGDGIPAADIVFKVLNAKGAGQVHEAIEQLLTEANANKLLVCDITCVQRDGEILVIGFFRR